MKKAHKLALAFLCLIASALLAVACAKDPAATTPSDPENPGSTNPPASGDVTVSVPTEVKLTSAGELTWKNVSGVTWQVSLDGSDWTDVAKNKIDLLEDLVPAVGSATARVRAKSGDAVSDAATLTFTVAKLDAPGKPERKEDATTHKVTIDWTAPDGVNAFLVNQNGGDGWVTYRSTSFAPASTGTYTLIVKSKGYAEPRDNKLYLNSDASESSGAISFLAGVGVTNDTVNTITIHPAAGDEFDSYELYARRSRFETEFQKIEGDETLKSLAEGGAAVDLVENGFITATGEYDLMVKATKGSDSSWSEIMLEFGTTNINENEIASFDNRMASFSNPQGFPADSYELSNEQNHGDGESVGYSMHMVGGGSGDLTYNLRRYAAEGSENAIDFRLIDKISYWVYIPSGQNGLPADNMTDNSVLPGVRWEICVYGGTANEAWFATAVRPSGLSIPYDQWTKVEFNIQCRYDNVFILVLNQKYEYYIDDICFDSATLGSTKDVKDYSSVVGTQNETPGEGAGYDYRVNLDRIGILSGAWYGKERTAIDVGTEYAGKTVVLTMKAAGNAPASAGKGTTGFITSDKPFWRDQGNTDTWTNGADSYQFIDASMLSTLTDDAAEWKDIIVQTKVDAEGKAYFAALRMSGNAADGTAITEPYTVFLKDVKVAGDTDAVKVVTYGQPKDRGDWDFSGGRIELCDLSDQDVLGKQVTLTLTVSGNFTDDQSAIGGFGLLVTDQLSTKHNPVGVIANFDTDAAGGDGDKSGAVSTSGYSWRHLTDGQQHTFTITFTYPAKLDEIRAKNGDVFPAVDPTSGKIYLVPRGRSEKCIGRSVIVYSYDAQVSPAD